VQKGLGPARRITVTTMDQNPLERRGSNYDFLLRRPSAILETQFEEAILLVGAATSPLELRLAVTSGLHTALPDVVCSLVLLVDVETQQLAYFETNDSLIYMPTSGLVWDSVKRRSPDMLHKAIPSSDPICTLYPGLPTTLQEGQVVILVPVTEAKGHQVVAFMLAVCTKPLTPHDEKLQWLKKNVLVASQRVVKHAAAEKERRRAEGMLRVCGDLIDLDISILSLKIHKHLKSILDAKASMLLIVDEVTNEFICQTFDDVALDTPFSLPMGETLYGRCVESGKAIIIDNVAQDMRYNPAIDTINNYEPSSMICMPVQVQREGHSSPKTIAVAVVFDKAERKGGKFTSRDEENMGFVLRFSSTVLANTLAYQREMLLRKHNVALLEMARNLFSSVSDQDKLLRAVMNEAKKLTNAERCSVFLLDPQGEELVASVFDGAVQAKSSVRIAVGQGIAGFVAKTGEIVNIKDAYKHPKFFKDIDRSTGFHTRNILCFPIKNDTGDVVGVAELCNKVGVP
jgi:cGMP-dependent 3',5'-cyclic phosphodiesterase